MDKRVERTKQKVYTAFADLLREGDSKRITVEDILSRANVSRSTFYAHFKTKQDVLDSLSRDIFEHVFSHSLREEKTHDFSKSSVYEYDHLLTHILYHLHDEKELVSVILKSNERSSFLQTIREELLPVASFAVSTGLFAKKEVPPRLQESAIIESFIVLIRYWFDTDCKENPETLTSYFFAMNS